MSKKDILNKYSLSETTLRNWVKLGYISNINNITIKEIEDILNNKNKTRRNKKNSTTHIIPTNYVKDKNILDIITEIISLKDKYNVTNNEILIEVIINILINKKIPSDVYKILGKPSKNLKFKNEIRNIKMTYSKEDDFLGCLYMSLLSQGKKDTKGIFFTPFSVIEEMVASISLHKGIKVLDPSCGSGNFLIQMYKKMKDNNFTTNEIINALHGYDQDKVATLITKLNLYSIEEEVQYDDLNVFSKDFLSISSKEKYDVIIGNPPWGVKYTKIEKEKLAKKYNNEFTKQDSFAQFIIKSFDILNDKGILNFVLPSSILNIATHKNIRKLLLNYDIKYINNIGRKFHEVVTDAVIINVTKSKTTDNVCLYNNIKIKQDSFYNNYSYNFLVASPIAQSIIDKLKKTKHYHLEDSNSQFSLGIVTGNNNKYLFNNKVKNSEPIISGKDLTKYNFDYNNIKKYIIFDKPNLQQVSLEENYRKKKIIYKFIGKKLCFCVEEKGILTLNSANIINIKNKDIYYICAILNSRVTQLFFDETYKTFKVLKNHIQTFYIFEFDEKIMKKISNLSKNTIDNKYNEKIENIIYENLGLSDTEIEYLINKY